jgi:hypothetical protein
MKTTILYAVVHTKTGKIATFEGAPLIHVRKSTATEDTYHPMFSSDRYHVQKIRATVCCTDTCTTAEKLS